MTVVSDVGNLRNNDANLVVDISLWIMG